MTATELAGFGISASTVGSKASEIRNMFNISQFDMEWTLFAMIDTNHLVWMVVIDGLIVDIRNTSLEIQKQAFEMGIIPYVNRRPAFIDELSKIK